MRSVVPKNKIIKMLFGFTNCSLLFSSDREVKGDNIRIHAEDATILKSK